MESVNDIIDISIKHGEEEIRDLKIFWDDLSWQERDNSIQFAFNFLKNDSIIPKERSLNLQKHIDAIVEEANRLDSLNAKEKPSKLLRLKQKLGSNKDHKLIFNKISHIIMNLTEDELINLGKYFGIENVESFRGRKIELCNLYEDVFLNCTNAKFDAFKNHLEKLVS